MSIKSNVKTFIIKISENDIKRLKSHLLLCDLDENDLDTNEKILCSAFGYIDFGWYGIVHLDKSFDIKGDKK